MDISKYVKITSGKPAAAKPSQSGQPRPIAGTGTGQKSSLSQKQLMGIGLIAVGVILIGIAIMSW